MKMVRMPIQLPVNLKKKLDALRKEGTTASGLIRHLLEQHFTTLATAKKGRWAMKTQLNAGTAAPLPKTHTIRLNFFNDTPEDQALYAALRASCDQDCRTPLSRQIKYQLSMTMGLLRPDSELLDRLRLGLSNLSQDECATNEEAAYVPSTPTRPTTTLRLIPGGADKQERTITHDNNGRT